MRRAVRMLFGILSLLLLAMPAAAQSVCGNAVREPGEQCDDGNTQNADGCSAQCLFEQNQRMNQLKMQFGTSTVCTQNALGSALVGGTAQQQIQQSIDQSVADGSTSIILAMLGLDDLDGVSDPAIEVGVVNGTPLPPAAGSVYNGTSDLDWWYAPSADNIDATRLPLARLNGSIAARQLTAGPGSVSLAMPFGGSAALLYVTTARLFVTTGTSTVPAAATGPYPPGHLASENLDPALQSFATAGTPAAGQMCGNIRAASLAAIPVPSILTGGGLTSCSQNYSLSNSMLDVLISGCTIFFIQQIRPTQPDQVDADAPPAGAGPPYHLTANATTKIVTGCTANGQAVDLTACLNAAAYSSYFKFGTDRVIEKPPCPDAPVAANDGPACTGATIHLTAAGPSGIYHWTGPNGFTSTLQNPTIANATAADAGTYSVTVMLAGCTSAAATTSVTVNEPPSAPVISAPSTAAAQQTGLSASVTANAGSTYAWTITNGVITAGQGTSQITFTAGASGSTGLGVIETAATGCSSPQGTASVVILLGAPQGVVATATSATSVTIGWSATAGAATYEVARQDVGVLGSTASLTFNDTTAAPDTAYLYTVRARDASNNPSPFSNADLATTVMFTDDPLEGGTTIVKIAHLTELRTAVNAVRALTPLGAFSFTDPTLTTETPVKAVHVAELRAALDQARSNLGFPAWTYTDPALTAGTTFIKAAHLQEIRQGVK